MSYYQEPESHIGDIVKVVLDLSNYATKKKLDHATGVDGSDLPTKKDFIALKADELVNDPTSLYNLKTNVDDLDVGKSKTILVELKKLSDVVDN